VTERTGSCEASRLDPTAVAALYVRHAEELRAYLIGLLRDPDLAADVLQATFSKAVERGHTAEGSLKAWLFRVAHNEAMDQRRRKAAEGRALRRVAWWKSETLEHDPQQRLRHQEIVEHVRKALETLPPAQQEVVRMKIYEEKTFAEIAAQLHCPLGTVLTRMRLATQKLAEALRGELES
jgi:RNA polymerase sigma factor (sigma-70 family)